MEARNGVTLIELLVILTIISIFILAGIWVWKIQLMKGRDGKRKADLKKLQTILEDYLNDKDCYPSALDCDQDFSPYLSAVFCDPLNNTDYNYSYEVTDRTWYKIYARLETEDDPIIEQVGCSGGCGPGNNYNYFISSPNVL